MFLLWGAYAQAKTLLIDAQKHFISSKRPILLRSLLIMAFSVAAIFPKPTNCFPCRVKHLWTGSSNLLKPHHFLRINFFHIAFFFVLGVFSTHAQQKYSLLIFDVNDTNAVSLKQSSFSTPFERDKELRKYIDSYIDKGYIAFSIDSLSVDSVQKKVFVNKGPLYKWVTLKPGHREDIFLLNAGFKESQFKNKNFNPKKLKRLKERCLVYCENNGYPFAEVKLDSVNVVADKVSAIITCDKKNRVIFDSLNLEGNAQINKLFLMNYCGIRMNSPYNESIIKAVDRKMNNLPFLKLKQPISVIFQENSYVIKMVAARRDASNFDGILGIAPDNITGKVVLTGDVKLKLVNAFKAAEQIDLNWKHLDKNSQKLLAGYSQPYLFNTPFGCDYKLDLLQKDTTYISVKNKGTVKYLFDGFDHVNLMAELFKSNLLNNAAFSSMTTLPDYADVSSYMLGMGFQKEAVDFRYNPSKGYTLNLSIEGGDRTIYKNPFLNEALYNSVAMKSKKYRWEFQSAAYVNPFSRHVLMMGVNSGQVFSKSLFQNELYRLGGTHLLRGFDEESILASTFAVFTTEYRFLLGELSYLNLFFDGAYYENYSFNNHICDRPLGFGTGFTFETKQGVFSISYALGKQFNNPLQFKSGKVHLGFVAFF
ncbi:MAG: Outer membrane protein assembly factor BamA [Bacteroidetes bacterium ADurb.Bin408]|nr:MAG: Outer membrane protein assembly factor BamA [Bacteroidetes bacterium ADurb.Bin408]